MKLTREDIRALVLPELHRDGRAKLAYALRIDPTVKGWTEAMIGMEIEAARYQDILRVVSLPKLRNIPHGEAPGQTALF
jgi:hypothetical protein